MIIFVWFIGIQILGPDEQFFDQSGHSIIYNGTFTWKKSDGTKQNISVPGRYKVPAKQTMIITTTLPDDYNENVIAIRSSLQDVRFYIDGKLRKEYNAKSLHRFGKNSASRYIFCNTSSADAGKELRLELTTYTSNYSGVVNTIYCGDQMQIWSYIFNHNFSGTVIGSFIFFASIVTILFSIALGIVYKTKFNMEYLGWCMLMGSVWMIGESKMRQILVPNASGLATSCFIMLMLCPLPISLYVNNLQKGKYKKIFQSICFIALLNFIICTILHLTGVADYIETMPAAHAILIITFLAVILTFLIRYWNHRNRSDCLLFFGLLITMLSVIFEAISVYYKVSVSGLFVGIAILILLFINVIYTIHIIRDIIKRQQQEELDKRKKNIEEMSLQLMQMLSTTIEAKDEYTKGHSHRVAEYSVLIARELGWNEKELSNLKNAAHLHDIGKIAIPDTILNKPSKLSEEEFSIIKEHTIIGANILKNISLIMSTIRTQKAKENLDFLTGLPTRNKGEQAIAQLMKHHSGCLVFMDMDNLKTINDIYGHKAGDRVLKLLGNLLLEYSSECLVCRLGGDEFLLFMPNADQNSITEVITAIFKKFNTRKEQDPELHAASISAGLYMCNIGDSFDECYTKADKTLYFVKQNGKSDFSFHEK